MCFFFLSSLLISLTKIDDIQAISNKILCKPLNELILQFLADASEWEYYCLEFYFRKNIFIQIKLSIQKFKDSNLHFKILILSIMRQPCENRLTFAEMAKKTAIIQTENRIFFLN